MSFKVWQNTPLVSSNEVGTYSTFTGDGTTRTFTAPNSDNTQVGRTIQYGSTQKFLDGGGFIKNTDGSTITINEAPLAGVQGVIPNIDALTVSAYDQAIVSGVTNPTISEKEFYIGDMNEIYIYEYYPKTGSAGIELLINDSISSAGAAVSWLQLACADVNGNALTYAATGTSLYTAEIAGFSTLAATAASTVLTVLSASGFYNGDYIIVNIGGSSVEVAKIIAHTSNTLTLNSVLNYPHYIGESVYTCARKFWMKLIVPIDVTNNQAQNFYDLGLRINAKKIQR